MSLRVPMAFAFLPIRNVTVPQIVLVVMMKIIALNRNLQFNLNHLSRQFNLKVCRLEENKIW